MGDNCRYNCGASQCDRHDIQPSLRQDFPEIEFSGSGLVEMNHMNKHINRSSLCYVVKKVKNITTVSVQGHDIF